MPRPRKAPTKAPRRQYGQAWDNGQGRTAGTARPDDTERDELSMTPNRTIPRVCEFCSVAFLAREDMAAMGYGRFCGRVCQGKALRRPLPERFWAKVNKTGECWLWTASFDGRGYGQIGAGPGRNKRSHRVAWELTYGPIPEGMYVCHHCDTKACVRPDHLFLGTHGDNVRDMIAKKRSWPQNRPELLPRGDQHWTRLHPEKVARGSANGRSRARRLAQAQRRAEAG